MAATFDAVTAGPQLQTQSGSVSHTTSGANRLMLVCVHGDDVLRTVSTVTYGAASLTSAAARQANANFGWVHWWKLVAPATGAATVTVTLDAVDTNVWTFTAITFNGADQTTPLGTFASATATDTTPSVTVSGATNDLIVDGVTWNDDVGRTATVGAGQTERRNGVSASQIGFLMSTEPGAASVVMDWTLSAARDWSSQGVAVKAAAGAAVQPGSEDETQFIFARPILSIFLAEDVGFNLPPPPTRPSAEDDFILYLRGWPTYLEDTSGFFPLPPLVSPTAEDDFVKSLPMWTVIEGDLSGFFPLPPLIQPAVEDDFVRALPAWPMMEDDTSGFAPLPPLAQPGVEEMDWGQRFQGSLAAFVPLDELGFPTPVARQIIWLD